VFKAVPKGDKEDCNALTKFNPTSCPKVPDNSSSNSATIEARLSSVLCRLRSAVAVVKSDTWEIAVLRRPVIVSRIGEIVISEAVPEAIVALIAPVWTLMELKRSLWN